MNVRGEVWVPRKSKKEVLLLKFIKTERDIWREEKCVVLCWIEFC